MRKKINDFLSFSFINLNPRIRVLVQEIILIGLGIIVNIFKRNQAILPSFGMLVGVFLVIIAFVIHRYSQRVLKEAHKSSVEIKKIVKEGIYSKIRHPIYASLMIMDIGFVFLLQIAWLFILVVIFAFFNIATIYKEEEILLKKFKQEYKEYMTKVPWRLVPNIY